MSDLTMEMENKNLAIEDEIVNSDNPEVETVTINDTEVETNNDENEVDTSTNGDTENEIAASETGEGNIDPPDETGVLAATENLDDTEFQEDNEVQENKDNAGDEAALDDLVVQNCKEVPDEIASIDAAVDKIAKEDQVVDGHDTGVETLSSDAEKKTDIVDSDLTEPETGNSDKTETEITSEDAEGETDNSENAKAEAADGEISTGDGVETETPISDNPEDKLPDNLTEEPRNEEEMHLALLRGNTKAILQYLHVSDDDGDWLGNREVDQEMDAIFEAHPNPEASDIESLKKDIEVLKNLLTRSTIQVNMVEGRYSGMFTKYRIRLGMRFIKLKEMVKIAEGPNWVAWFKKNIGGREFRSAQDYMGLAKVPGIIRYAVFGKERLLQIKRQLTEADLKTADPVGNFISRNGMDFNPEEEVDVQELKIETDIAIECQKLLKEELEIPKNRIDTLVRNGRQLTAANIDELKIRKELGHNLTAALDRIVASDGKTKPPMTAERRAEGFKKKTDVFLKAIDSALSNHDLLYRFNMDLVARLKQKVLEIEQLVQARTERAGVSSDEGNSSQAQTEGGELI